MYSDATINKGASMWMVALVASVMGVLGLAQPVSAQNVNLNQFRPTERARDGFSTSTAADQGHLKFGVQLYLDYSDDPLIASTGQKVVDQQLTGNIVMSLGTWDRVIWYVGLPYHFILRGDGTAPAGLLPAGDGLGDLWVGARVRLWGEEKDIFQIAVQGAFNFYTAQAADNNQQYRGDVSKVKLGGHPELLFGFNAVDERLRVPFNVGYWLRGDTTIGGPTGVRVGDELTYGAGVIFDTLKNKHALDVMVETFGRTGASSTSRGFATKSESPLEVLGGLKYHHPDGLHVGAAATIGVLDGYGAPDWRFIGMLGYTMPKDTTPPDKDGDGIPNEKDQCPDDPEDIDGFQDEDGCPEPDNDGDGILDVNDGAPNDPEDMDGFQDEDGVPDPDNDGDGIPDTDDKCPNEAGPPELDGCPDPDRDGDGVPDRIDNCPDEPGTVENKGCKDKQLVEIKDDRLEILERIYFKTGSSRIRSRSFNLLDNIADVIKAHPEISTVQVEGHTDSVGALKYNMRLSQRRADSVVRYLTRKGVGKDRLTSKGFGPTKPVVPDAKTREELAQNRRVEFNIPKPEPAPPAPAEEPAKTE